MAVNTLYALLRANRRNLDVTIRVRKFAAQDKIDTRAVGDLGTDSGPSLAGLPRTG